jgi:hypothetical protein
MLPGVVLPGSRALIEWVLGVGVDVVEDADVVAQRV